jgi:DNA-directed RNA polymerase alpha subunit
MKITIEIENIDELAKLKSFIDAMTEPKKHDLSESIYCLELSTRPHNALMGAGIDTLEKLLRLTEVDLLLIQHLGARGVSEIKKNLNLMGEKLAPYNGRR